MNFNFLVIEPGLPENIGAAARALKTMGFESLRLINPCNYLNNQAKWIAHGSYDILEKALVYNDFNDAISDMDFIIGTSAKQRNIKFDYYSIEDINKIILSKGNTISKIAIVFGKEESGLSNEMLQKCDIVSYIPMNSVYPSLNLGQAIMLYAYKLYLLVNITEKKSENDTNRTSYKVFMSKIDDVLQTLQFKKGTNIYNRMIERLSIINQNDMNLLNSVANRILNKEDK